MEKALYYIFPLKRDAGESLYPCIGRDNRSFFESIFYYFLLLKYFFGFETGN